MFALMFGLGLPELLVWIVVIAAGVAIVCVLLKVFGVAPPPWFITICWICLAAAVGVLAIRFVFSL